MAQFDVYPNPSASAQQRFDALLCQCLEEAGMQRRDGQGEQSKGQSRGRAKRSAELVRLRRQRRQAVSQGNFSEVARLDRLYRRQAQVERRRPFLGALGQANGEAERRRDAHAAKAFSMSARNLAGSSLGA